MSLPARSAKPAPPALLARLGDVAADRGLAELAINLHDLNRWIGNEMAEFEQVLAATNPGPSLVERTSHHLLDLDGKHLRPMCVLLAARLGGDVPDVGYDLAMAVELVHSATLLHDDVVDSADTRRGVPAARVLYGNAASIFAGDWLLVQALSRVRRAENMELLDMMLSVIDEMILAESVQLENRGRLNSDMGDYFVVVEGKTAALFRWAMYAGAAIGGLTPPQCRAVERFGLHLGVAFQAVDDLLDVDGDSQATGKALYADLREGKLTYPLIVALDRDPELRGPVERCIERAGAMSSDDADTVVRGIRQTGAVAACRGLAKQRAEQAIASLADIQPGPGKEALVTLAHATIHRNR